MNNAPVGRVYRMSWWFKALALFFLLFGGLLLTSIFRDILEGEKTHGFWEIVVSAVFPLVGAGMSAKAFTSRIAFTETSVVRESFWGSRTTLFAAIRGRREYVVRGGEEGGITRYLRLESNDGSAPLDFGKKLYRFDDAFWQWFRQLPDLDGRDKEVHKDSGFGMV